MGSSSAARAARQLWIGWIRPFLWVAAIVFPLRSSIADWYVVPTGSMKPTIVEGDRILVNKLAYDLKVPFTSVRLAKWSEPERGDIVVFSSPADGTRLVKRVIGLPGDELRMQNNRLLVNGKPVEYRDAPSDVIRTEVLPERPHEILLTPSQPALRSFPSVRVPAGHYFMMGDNRDNSGDSRYFGFVPLKSVMGEAVAVVASLDRTQYYLPRLDRFLKALQ